MQTPTRTKVALITGASSGIGYELTQQLVSKLHYQVYAAARRVGPLEELQAKLGADKVIPVQLDVCDSSSIEKLKQKLMEELPERKLDLLYNNAGQSCTFPALDVTSDNIEAVFRVNVFGPMNLTRELSPFLINAATKGNVPVIAFTGSLAGTSPFPFASVYAATKAAVHQYARVLHLEMKPFGVKVLNVITGGVHTDIADKRSLPATSIYNFKEGLEAFKYRQEMSKNNHPEEPKDYCSEIIKDIAALQNSSRDPVDVYRGTKALFMRIVMMLVPYYVLEMAFMRKFKLNPAFNAVKARKREDAAEEKIEEKEKND
ncbi:NADPH-dependent 1-acyldihydroxyacetone phosphate reductase [Hanseniaspora osmophila]|uniref:NADPH-dependent 1-acyldihydroxyacetone phosphate reductase n=1 Tax=Hanseniaspora osmophila TaxID=56408 RepID=A0A1E5RNR0_9ASCO|nr:NADPH-dependent 1-acyldihydroxyacetone phosphate reductase [Hanseniaspora osmophila]